MSAPSDKPSIDWRGATPYATRFDDLYYSADDPVGEVRHTFLDGVDFTALCRKPHLCIAETGFGTGLNFLEAWREWDRTAPPGAILDFLSVEAFPLATEDLVRAHACFPEHRERASALQAQWPGAVPGLHRLSLGGGRVRLLLMIGDAADCLARMSFQADAWFLDGFAPAKNPEMWRPEVLAELARLSGPDTRLATFTAAGAVRRGLADQGFEVEKRPGFGRKRDCLTARYTGSATSSFKTWHARPAALPKSARITVIGAGIAGAATTHALRRSGREVLHIGGHDSRRYAASTLPLALIAPKLVRGDQPFPTFWRQAFHDAIREIDALQDHSSAPIWQGPRGLIIPGAGDDAQAKLLAELQWPETQARAITADAAIAQSGLILSEGLAIAAAGTVDAAALINALLDTPPIARDVARIAQSGSGWQLIDQDEQVLYDCDALVLACGAGTAQLLAPDQDQFGLRIGAGQKLIARTDRPIHTACLQDGYITASTEDGRIAIGASARARAPIDPVESDPAITEALIARQAPRLDGRPLTDVQTWTGLRCDTGDHLPLVGPIPDFDAFQRDYAGLRVGKKLEAMVDATHRPGLYTLSALGARGFQGAFLAADILTSTFDARPLPVTTEVAKALLPGRIQIRTLIKGG